MTGTFSCTLKFIVKDCDPNTGEADDDGYEDEYVVSFITIKKMMSIKFVVISLISHRRLKIWNFPFYIM